MVYNKSFTLFMIVDYNKFVYLYNIYFKNHI